MNATAVPGGASKDRKIALLRGINVGRSARIAMADLRSCTESAGCGEVRTVLATGNVVFTDPRPADEVRTTLEAAYTERFEYNAAVQVFTRDAVEAAVAAYPFESLDEHHDYVVFSDDPEVTGTVADTMGAAIDPSSTESVAAGPGCIYWRVPKGATLSSEAAKALANRAHQRHLTSRNIRTLRKILAGV
ncbi:DUF1697 domain-containing protein [Dietzia sp. ANT_WB102]|uniref:DUF1697 domain-containing protein n=1 Tax=Dietzia sp. ANT_WB102 TaxID=2597345 RepID=UPI0011EDCC95|nr:DUF1697 domain-containing protein [Dietzia sp. ANT_WB102]KAA0918565.1 DUF1697 domain-containing protein [Dietzia sp. ANT_WB102]